MPVDSSRLYVDLIYNRDKWTMIVDAGVLRVEDWNPESRNVHENATVVGKVMIGPAEESGMRDALERLRDLEMYDLTDWNYDGTGVVQCTGALRMFAMGRTGLCEEYPEHLSGPSYRPTPGSRSDAHPEDIF